MQLAGKLSYLPSSSVNSPVGRSGRIQLWDWNFPPSMNQGNYSGQNTYLKSITEWKKKSWISKNSPFKNPSSNTQVSDMF